MLRPLLLALVVAACARPDAPAPASATAMADSTAFVGTWWRLQSLGGEAPVEGVRPVLIFTADAALRDTYDRPYPDSLRDWRIVTGDLGVGHLHAPYVRAGDTLRFAETYAYTRLSTDAEIAQARRLSNALELTRTAAQDGDRLVLFGRDRDTLAVFAADPPRLPGPLDDHEWVLSGIGTAPGPAGPSASSDVASRPVPGGSRADLTFTSRRLGPGPDDGFDAFDGYTGCNWYSGGYRLVREDVGRFRLETAGPPLATQRGCAAPADAVEEAVLGALLHTASVAVDRNGEPTDDGRTATGLVLRDSAGRLLLAFRRHQPGPVDLGALRRGRWRFASTESALPVASGVTVAFADSTFTGTDGCYRTSGTYRVEGDDLFVASQSGDGSACPPGGSDRPRVVPITSGKLAVTADRLTLSDENGVATHFTR